MCLVQFLSSLLFTRLFRSLLTLGFANWIVISWLFEGSKTKPKSKPKIYIFGRNCSSFVSARWQWQEQRQSQRDNGQKQLIGNWHKNNGRQSASTIGINHHHSTIQFFFRLLFIFIDIVASFIVVFTSPLFEYFPDPCYIWRTFVLISFNEQI